MPELPPPPEPVPSWPRPLRSFALLILLLFWAVANAGCVIDAEAELPDVELASRNIAIPAAPPEADSNEPLVTVTFRQKPNRAGLSKDAFQEVRVRSVNLAARGGIADLGFLRSFKLSAASDEDAAAGKKPIQIASYVRPAAVAGREPPAMPTLEIASTPPVDVTALWRAKEIVFTIDVAGQLPSVAWTTDVAVRVDARLGY